MCLLRTFIVVGSYLTTIIFLSRPMFSGCDKTLSQNCRKWTDFEVFFVFHSNAFLKYREYWKFSKFFSSSSKTRLEQYWSFCIVLCFVSYFWELFPLLKTKNSYQNILNFNFGWEVLHEIFFLLLFAIKTLTLTSEKVYGQADHSVSF